MNSFLVGAAARAYKNLAKPVLFRRDPEAVHGAALKWGERLGKSSMATKILAGIFTIQAPALRQRLFGLDFSNPIGLAAGFDYEGRLTQILPALGFGFETVGTLTAQPYEGNPKPILGRLPQSRALMVNKGFKNLGVTATLERLQDKIFACPVGISIGRTNTPAHKTQRQAVADVVRAFKKAEAREANVSFSYYELNISCPNLVGSIEFYAPGHLSELLDALAALNIQRPVFIKMPITKTDDEIRAMLDVVVRYPFIQAVIFGNLQRDRRDPALMPSEVARFPAGGFSGLPCQKRSDELIRLAYRHCGSALKVIGCGGVFSAADAYQKIRLGASLVQLITGLVFEGPQLIAQINQGLVNLLKRDGCDSVSQAIGADA